MSKPGFAACDPYLSVLLFSNRSHTAIGASAFALRGMRFICPGLRDTRPDGAESIHSSKSRSAFSTVLAFGCANSGCSPPLSRFDTFARLIRISFQYKDAPQPSSDAAGPLDPFVFRP